MPPHDPKPATPEAQALLRAAERDWKTVQVLVRDPEAPISSVCFHAQQYLEKMLRRCWSRTGSSFVARTTWENWQT